METVMTPVAAPAKYSVTRNEDHSYVLDGRLMPGVTTILEAAGKPWLAAWKVKDLCMMLGAQSGPLGSERPSWKKAVYIPGGLWNPGVAYTEQEIVAAINTARQGSKDKSDAAKDTGTIAHEWIEAAISAELIGAPAPKYPDDPEAALACQSWYAWRQDHEVEWYASESIVASREHWYGGTFDARANVRGPVTGGVWRKVMLDWKTSKEIYAEYWMQFSAYYEAHKEMTGDEDDYLRVGARIPKDGKALEWVAAPAWATHALCFQSFLGCLSLHRFNQAAAAARGK